MMSPERLVSNEGYVPVLYSNDSEDRKIFLRRAARDGHLPAMYEYARQCDDPAEKRRWFRDGYGPEATRQTLTPQAWKDPLVYPVRTG